MSNDTTRKMTPRRFRALLMSETKKAFKFDAVQSLLTESLNILKTMGFSVYENSLEQGLDSVFASMLITWSVMSENFSEVCLLYIGPDDDVQLTYWKDIPLAKTALYGAFLKLGYECRHVEQGSEEIPSPAVHVILKRDVQNNLISYLEIVSEK